MNVKFSTAHCKTLDLVLIIINRTVENGQETIKRHLEECQKTKLIKSFFILCKRWELISVAEIPKSHRESHIYDKYTTHKLYIHVCTVYLHF